MTIFNFLSLIGGLALFLFGMNVMGSGLEKMGGGKFESVLEKMTNNRIKGVLLGAGVTAVIQSSSAVTVMAVGFVNSGIMALNQVVGIIMGANIGTCITSWLLSLTGIESSNVFLTMLKPSTFSPILALIGIVLYMFCKSEKKKELGSILLGFSTLMFGMEAMSGAVAPLESDPAFTGVFTMFSNPILGVLVGMILTAIIQFFRFRGYSASTVRHRCHLRGRRIPHYFGAEYWYLRHGADLQYRHQQKRQAYRCHSPNL